MRRNPFALVEDLDGAGSEAHLDLGTDEAMREAVVVRRDFDVIVDAAPADAPLGKYVSALRQRLQSRPIDLLQQLAPSDAEPPDRPFLAEARQQLGDRGISPARL